MTTPRLATSSRAPLEIDANLYQAQQVLAKVHAALGENEYAIEAGRRYLQQQPDNLEMRLLVAQSLVRLGKLQEAKRELYAIEESKRGAEGNYALGRVHLGLGEYKEARKYLELADAAAPRNPDILSEPPDPRWPREAAARVGRAHRRGDRSRSRATPSCSSSAASWRR